ncbi:class I SAM-dependent methyltransferase [Rhodophyticola porphyridii]|uniref:Class I SAM-dependent methyltransferase n=1 Tax=Rhodophyticola porphyridii TaxID=1852017 RepID=A0A3L9Y5K4_9RHOB|nr:class I SAM-dependent methyltransferase [Rhodophyticola porphyridii]RMA42337.1 class I SAM-dependent methyltransferase [Rhodophyticola porphyridii]
MSQEKKEFDQSGYWIDRHRQYIGDPRSIGNMGKTRAENEQGDIIVQSLCQRIAQHYSKNLSSVLDLGCGYGRIAGSFIDQSMKYTGLDVSVHALQQAKRKHPKGRFIQKDLNEWNPTGTFNLVCALYILVHFVDDSLWKAFFGKAAKSVIQGGYLIIADEFPAQRRSSKHYVARPFQEYLGIMEKEGLELDTSAWDDVFGDDQPGSAKAFKFLKKT